MNKYLKIALWFFGVLAVLIISILAVAYFRPQLFMVPFFKYESKPYLTQMSAIPTKREPIKAAGISTKQSVEMYAIKLDLPWADKPERKDSSNGKTVILKFPDGKTIGVIDKRGDENDVRKSISDMIKEKLKKYPNTGETESTVTKDIFGDLLNGSRYEVMKNIAYTTPDQLKISDSVGKVLGKIVVLELKFGISALGKMYTFSVGGVNVLEFITDGGSEILFVFTNNGDEYDILTSKVAQEELDFILSSIKPITK